MGSAKDVLDELRVPTRELRKAAPGAWAGFGQMHDAATVHGPRAWAACQEFSTPKPE